MSGNGVSGTDDVDMAECDQEKVVTMMDVLKEQQEFEEDADAVLGASDDKECTYSKGYIKRQAIYACLTCCEDAKTDPSKRAGVCLACSLSCHENHDLVELYTKRNFRCDCGNPKFNSQPCQFVPEKADLNEDNHYDQNFSGLYCTCHRPYPDPEFPVEDEMIQCIICEDWLHACHLKAMVPANEQYAEMICKGCMDKNDFLHDYSDIAVTAEPDDVDVVNATNTDVTMTKDTSECNGNLEKEPINGSVELSDLNEKETTNDESGKNERMESDFSNDTKNYDENIPAEVSGPAEKVSEENDIKNKESDSPIESKEQNKDDISLPKDIVTEATGEVTTNEKEQNKDDNTVPKDIVTEAAGDITTNETEQNKDDNTPPKDIVTEATGENAKEPVSSTLEPGDKTKDAERINKTETNIEDEEKEKCEAEKDLIGDSSNKIEQSSENQLPENEPQQLSKEKPEADEEITKNSSEKIEQSNEDQSAENLPELSKETFQESQTLEKSNQSSMNVDQEENETDVYKNNKSSEDQEESKTDADKNKESLDPTKDNDIPDEHFENKIETKSTEESNETVPETNDVADKEKISEKDKDKDKITEDKTFNNDIVMGTDKEEKIVESPNNNEISDFKDSSENEVSENTLKESELTTKTLEIKESKRKLSTEELSEEVTTKKPKLDASDACLRPKGVKRKFKGATFWPSQFRQKLCTCNECISMYKDLSVLFLIDPEDTVSAYETLGKEKIDGTPASQYEKGLQALSSLDRIQQINALTEYNRMRDKLLDFLKSFKDRKEVVKEEDIKAFFARMKPKREPDGVYFCR